LPFSDTPAAPVARVARKAITADSKALAARKYKAMSKLLVVSLM